MALEALGAATTRTQQELLLSTGVTTDANGNWSSAPDGIGRTMNSLLGTSAIGYEVKAYRFDDLNSLELVHEIVERTTEAMQATNAPAFILVDDTSHWILLEAARWDGAWELFTSDPFSGVEGCLSPLPTHGVSPCGACGLGGLTPATEETLWSKMTVVSLGDNWRNHYVVVTPVRRSAGAGLGKKRIEFIAKHLRERINLDIPLAAPQPRPGPILSTGIWQQLPRSLQSALLEGKIEKRWKVRRSGTAALGYEIVQLASSKLGDTYALAIVEEGMLHDLRLIQKGSKLEKQLLPVEASKEELLQKLKQQLPQEQAAKVSPETVEIANGFEWRSSAATPSKFRPFYSLRLADKTYYLTKEFRLLTELPPGRQGN